MRKKTEPSASAATSIDQLEADVADLLRAIDAERRGLRARILAGDNTAPVRARISALEDKMADAKARINELMAQRDAQLANDVTRDTADIAGKLVAALAAKLATLEPPQHPTK